MRLTHIPHIPPPQVFTSSPRAYPPVEAHRVKPIALFICLIALPELSRRSYYLLERDEAGRLGGTDTGATVRDRLVGDGELAKVVAAHLRLKENRATRCQTAAPELAITCWLLNKRRLRDKP